MPGTGAILSVSTKTRATLRRQALREILYKELSPIYMAMDVESRTLLRDDITAVTSANGPPIEVKILPMTSTMPN